MADDDSLMIIIVVDDKQFADKDVARLSILVFDKGVLVDPDAPPYLTQFGSTDDWHVPVTRISTGTYRASVNMTAIGVGYGSIFLKANATLGRTGPDDTSYDEGETNSLIPIKKDPLEGLSIVTSLQSISGDAVEPGTCLTFDVKYKFDGKSVDPSEMSLSLAHFANTIYRNGFEHDLQPKKMSIGHYLCSDAVPEVHTSGKLRFQAQGTINGQNGSSSIYLPLDFFSIIQHKKTGPADETAIELLVGDPDGRPVNEASVKLYYYFDAQYDVPFSEVIGSTNSSGSFTAAIRPPPGTYTIHLMGYVNASGKSQYFNQDVLVTGKKAPVYPGGNNFEVELTGGFSDPGPGKAMYRDCFAYNNYTPWVNKTIYCFVNTGFHEPRSSISQYTHSEVYTRETGENGKFTIPITAPRWADWALSVEFMTATGVHPIAGENGTGHVNLDGLEYSTCGWSMGFETMYPIFCETMDVHSVGSIPGETASIRCNGSAGDIPVGKFLWNFSDAPISDLWNAWVPVQRYWSLNGTKFRGTVVVPSFLPSGLNYTIYAQIEDEQLLWRYNIAHTDSNETIRPTPTPPKKMHEPNALTTDTGCISAGILILLTALGVSAYLLYYHRKRLPPQTKPPGQIRRA